MPRALEICLFDSRERCTVSVRIQVELVIEVFDRNKMIDAFQLWLKIDEKNVAAVKEIVGMLHNASLLVDDIEDNSLIRRGKPAAHLVYGKQPDLEALKSLFL